MKRQNTKIKILFDITVLKQFYVKDSKRSGIFWVAFNLLQSLCKRDDLDIYLYSSFLDLPKRFIADFSNKMPNIKNFTGDIKKMDVFLSPIYEIPAEIKKTGIPCWTIFYDCIPLIYPQYFGTGSKWYIDLINSLADADYAFSISEHTKKDFLKFCPQLRADRITTIPLSSNQTYSPNKNKKQLATIKKKYHIPSSKKYLFSLCSLEPRKNLIRAVRSFIKFIEKNKINDLVFVLGGGAWGGFIERLEKEVPEYKKYQNKIIRAGYVDDEDLEILYSNAEWFVYTSQYEGFGMPPLEAMSCGTAVITSNNSSLPEVVGDAGIMIDWDSDEQHIAAYEKYYFDPEFRQSMALKGLERSKLFSWDKAAEIMSKAFQKRDLRIRRKSFDVKDLYSSTPSVATKIKLFNFIPLLKIVKKGHNKKIKIFDFLPFYEYAQEGGCKQWKLFGLPCFKIRRMSNGITTKYYILLMPTIKVSQKVINHTTVRAVL